MGAIERKDQTEMADQDRKPNLKVGVEWITAEVLSEPFVVMSIRGYAPVVNVKTPEGEFILYISSKSISEGLDPLVRTNGGAFKGLKLRLRKETEDKMAPYIVEKQ
jgi:hypothetical protein